MSAADQPNATIFVALLGEGTNVWRPVIAVPCGDALYRIISVNEDPGDEQWEFETGTVVRCELRRLAEGEKLVAVAEVK